MRLLLDTHILLWWLRDNPRLGPRTRMAIAAPGADLLVSIASFWELSIKTRQGKFAERGSALLDEAKSEGVRIVQVEASHLRALEGLEKRQKHQDPFDHLIVAQAISEGAMLVTGDKQIKQYDVPVFPNFR